MTRRERLERKLEKRQEWADKADTRAAGRFNRAHCLLDPIPPGQPILIGHHSEKGHRSTLRKADAAMAKGIEEQDKAAHHRGKAHGLARQLKTSIFSDDPDAVEALEERIAKLEARREHMKTVNRLYRKGDAKALAELGLDMEKLRADVAAIGYSWVKAPYAAYELQNIGQRITADRKRIESIRKRQERTEKAEAAGGVLIEGDEWVRVTFEEKPDRSILQALKAAGFRWGGGSWVGQRAKLPAEVTAL